ncbi:DUF397 domain-containing protein [Actinoalloteichus hymeniacidonis]|nr:DUF397 domain-containing protein [Actinoalloteichus hymeniacidonis]
MSTDRFTNWRTSTYTGEGNCVEVGHGPGFVGIRDTKDRGGGTLVVEQKSFAAFLARSKSGGFRPKYR